MTWIKAGYEWGIKGKIFEIDYSFIKKITNNMNVSELFFSDPEILEGIFLFLKKHSTNLPNDSMLTRVDFPMQKRCVQFFVISSEFEEVSFGALYEVDTITLSGDVL